MSDGTGDRHLAVERVVAEAGQVTTWMRVRLDDAERPALSFFTLDGDGPVSRSDEFWPEPYDPPAGREHLAERY